MSQDEQQEPIPTEDGEPPTETPVEEDKVEEAPPETLAPPPPPKETPEQKPPSKPIGPMPDTKKIIQESLEVISGVSTQLDKRKLFLASSAFLVYQLRGHLEDYREHINRVNSFLVTNHKLQEKWYRKYLQILPSYGDYDLVLSDSPEKISVEGLPLPIAEKKMKELVTDVVLSLYGGGQLVKTQRVMGTVVNQKMDEKREMTRDDYFHFDRWMSMLTGEVDNVNNILSSCFDVSSSIEFLNLD